MNLLIVLLFGLTIFIGTIIVLIKNNKKLQEVSLSMAFSIITLLVLFELIPEATSHYNYLGVITFSIIGILLIKLLDLFIPHHEHTDYESHILHIGIITSVALVLHNLIEGMLLYTTLDNTHIGALIGVGISLHNIPLGMVLGSTLYDKNNNKIKTLLTSLLISLTTFLGGLIIVLWNNFITDKLIGILLSITLGMLIYMAFFEILHHLKHQNKKNNLLGIILGIVLFGISLLFHHH